MIVVILLRFGIFLQFARLWRRARRLEKVNHVAKGLTSYGQKRRLPIIPSLHLLSVVILLLFFLLASTDKISASNGTSHLLMIAWVTPFCIIEGFSLRRIIFLGKKIIPWQGTIKGDHLGRFDYLLKALVVVMILLFILSWIFGLLGYFVQPFTFNQISLYCVFFHQVVYFFSLTYQVRLLWMRAGNECGA